MEMTSLNQQLIKAEWKPCKKCYGEKYYISGSYKDKHNPKKDCEDCAKTGIQPKKYENEEICTGELCITHKVRTFKYKSGDVIKIKQCRKTFAGKFQLCEHDFNHSVLWTSFKVIRTLKERKKIEAVRI